MIRSSVLLAACLGLWSCTSDPTADEAGVPTAIIATPGVAFVAQGSSQLLKFGLVDELGGLVPSTWTIGAVPPEFTVAFDSTFRVVYNSDGTLTLPDNQSEIRVTVTGVSSGAASFNVSASGITLPVTVSIVPTNVPATFNTTTPQIGENLVVTMPAGLTLLPGATFSVPGGAPPIVVSQAGDGSSVTLQLAPGSSGVITMDGVTPDFADLDLALPTTVSVTAGATSVFTGTDAYATAPLVVPGGFYDLGTWGGAADCGLDCQVYSVSVPAAGDYDFSLTWDNNTDLGLYFLDDTFTYLADACDAHGNGAGAGPEA
ncbi:MAG TPA: hypothetical protein PK948_06910, partial [Gemmatimonadales bacterium]|nr:hypothetical protein [Gemmatimonadales bacterium]